MRKFFTIFMLSIICVISSFSENPRTTITITDKNVTVSSYTDNEVVLAGQSDLHITAKYNSLTNSVLKLNSADSWVFFDNIRPQTVIDSLLKNIYVNNLPAVLKTNARV